MVFCQAKGGGTIHLTGFFNREYDPDAENGKSVNNMNNDKPQLRSGLRL